MSRPTGLLLLSTLLVACRDDPTSPDLAGAERPSAMPSAAAPLVFRAISTGKHGHTCGVTTADRAWCRGSNGEQNWPLGDGTKVLLRLRPVPVAGGLPFRHGYRECCAELRSAGPRLMRA